MKQFSSDFKSHLSMSYENQLLFYSETLKHRNKKQVLTQSWEVACAACSRGLARYAQLNYIPSCSKAFLSPVPFILFYFTGGGARAKDGT